MTAPQAASNRGSRNSRIADSLVPSVIALAIFAAFVWRRIRNSLRVNSMIPSFLHLSMFLSCVKPCFQASLSMSTTCPNPREHVCFPPRYCARRVLRFSDFHRCFKGPKFTGPGALSSSVQNGLQVTSRSLLIQTAFLLDRYRHSIGFPSTPIYFTPLSCTRLLPRNLRMQRRSWEVRPSHRMCARKLL